jgi:hypothetical protein
LPAIGLRFRQSASADGLQSLLMQRADIHPGTYAKLRRIHKLA